ncbi:MAG TPA: DUF962 domain-containing protein [Dokdonella sp.]|uniref:Mpo1 family 2-hydroxy fatty acid dioxygenase n=1 Tax=Dokdonella sp. TaxID=2291710 RepID=UPI0025C17F0C|nr:Mpo1-like protein [Dokdonella sp.]MBX3691096.1 DUF962 domain-containing protein [Dokdonella sp.]MCW5567130.1 DUF962 domain-containing protein [Dokdonella sp.]HNR92311.1 DUF962 domain-containing protein [Dokdonella sp.]
MATEPSAHEWFDDYRRGHRHPLNRLIDSICAPAILYALITLLWVVPVPESLGRPGFWAALAMVGVFAFCWRRSRASGLGMLVVLGVFGLLNEWLWHTLGPAQLLRLGAGVFVLAWIGRFIGQLIEGTRPPIRTDLIWLLIGPAWLVGTVMRRLGLAR